jgi:hypothetical protein
LKKTCHLLFGNAYIAFEDCIVAPNRFWYNQADGPFDHEHFSISVTIRLAMDPDIRIGLVNDESRT